MHSDEESTSVMETDPPSAASQRTPEIADTTEFPEVHRFNRTRKRCQPDETPAVVGRVPQSDPIHSERQPHDLDLEFLATLKLPRIKPDTSSFEIVHRGTFQLMVLTTKPYLEVHGLTL